MAVVFRSRSASASIAIVVVAAPSLPSSLAAGRACSCPRLLLLLLLLLLVARLLPREYCCTISLLWIHLSAAKTSCCILLNKHYSSVSSLLDMNLNLEFWIIKREDQTRCATIQLAFRVHVDYCDSTRTCTIVPRYSSILRQASTRVPVHVLVLEIEYRTGCVFR